MKKIFTLLTIFLSSLYSYSQCNILYDDFEGGTLAAQWLFGTGTYTRNVTSTNPAQGAFSFEQTGSSAFYEGTYATFSASQPSYISFKMRTNTTTAANGYVVIGDANINSDNGILFCYFNSTNSLRFYGSTGQNFPINPNQWYHVEVQNINWTARTMDIYLDGNLILTSWPFRSTTATTMDRIHLFNLSAATAMYDDIIIGSTPLTGSVTNTICNNDSIVVNGTIYNANNPSGTEVFVNGGANGCDSTVTVNLNVLPAIDDSITNNNPTLTANETGAIYQWLDCDNGNAVINGETSQSFTATVTGNYAVEITVGNCIDTSACENITVVGIDELSKASVNVYPNPNNGILTVDFSSTVSLVDYTLMSIDGKTVAQGKFSGIKLMLNLENEPKGIYFLKVENETINYVQKVFKN